MNTPTLAVKRDSIRVGVKKKNNKKPTENKLSHMLI